MTDTAEHTDIWTDLLTRWDRQQDVYIEQRESRFDIMFDFLSELAPGPAPTVLDLACGPGAISDRLRRSWPTPLPERMGLVSSIVPRFRLALAQIAPCSVTSMTFCTGWNDRTRLRRRAAHQS